MNKFKEIMATWFAVLGVLALVGATGAVETDQWLLAFTLFVIGTSTMFISIVCLNKQDLKHKIEAINWIMSNDPQFNYYCKVINIEPSYIQNKIKTYNDTRITSQQKVLLKPIVESMLKQNNYKETYDTTRI